MTITKPTANSSVTLGIARYANVRDNQPKQERVTWADLKRELTTHQEWRTKDRDLWSPASVVPGKTRSKANAEFLSALVIDVDDGAAPSDLTLAWERWEWILHSSYTSTPAHPKWRAVFPLARPVAAADWPRVHRRLILALVGEHADPSCKDASRMYYLPSHPPGGAAFVDAHDGEWLDPDAFPDPIEEPKRPTFSSNGNAKAAARGEGYYPTLDVIGWFKSHGCYGCDLDGGMHAVRCPWGDEHTEPDQAEDSDTVVWEAEGKNWPQFHCLHAHCDGRGIASVMELWGDADQFCTEQYVPPWKPPEHTDADAPPEHGRDAVALVADLPDAPADDAEAERPPVPAGGDAAPSELERDAEAAVAAAIASGDVRQALDLAGMLARLTPVAAAKLKAELKRAFGRALSLTDLTALIIDARREQAKASRAGAARGSSQSTRLVDLALASGADLFHSPAGIAYSTVPVGEHRETWAVHKAGFRRWLGRLLYQAENKIAGSQTMQEAINALDGIAQMDRPEMRVHIRKAEHDGAIYLDLGDRDWRAICIAPEGWSIVAEAPVKFRRPDGLLALPKPEAGGSLEDLREFVNVERTEDNDDDFLLVQEWLIAALGPEQPYPFLGLDGGQGAAKSTTARVLRRLTDPNEAELRRPPNDTRDLVIAANNGLIVAFDNLRALPQWLSDDLCSLATGGGFGTRKLFTDDEEMIFSAMRPALLNGIGQAAASNDLIDRGILLVLPRIAEGARKPEREFWARFNEKRGVILGALLDAVACGLQNLPTTRADTLPRMADFATLVIASSPALSPEKPEEPLQAYLRNRRDANRSVLQSSRLALCVGRLKPQAQQTTEGLLEWNGTATELLQALTSIAGADAAKEKGWPKDATRLSAQLRRIAANLAAAGIEIKFDREGRGRGRTIRIVWALPAADAGADAVASAGAASVRANQVQTDAADAADASSSGRSFLEKNKRESGCDEAKSEENGPKAPPGTSGSADTEWIEATASAASLASADDSGRHCWRCPDAALSAETHATCGACGWFVCDCGACEKGCPGEEPAEEDEVRL